MAAHTHATASSGLTGPSSGSVATALVPLLLILSSGSGGRGRRFKDRTQHNALACLVGLWVLVGGTEDGDWN